jgi:hypothetical protein
VPSIDLPGISQHFSVLFSFPKILCATFLSVLTLVASPSANFTRTVLGDLVHSKVNVPEEAIGAEPCETDDFKPKTPKDHLRKNLAGKGEMSSE